MLSEKIVVVDDDPRVIKSLKVALVEYEIKSFNNGAEALAYLRKPNLIHIVMLDVMMPGINGLATLKGIKKINKDIAVIMMTAFASKDIAIEALRLHADDFIEKPFDILEVKEKIRSLLKEKLGGDRTRGDGDKYVARIKRFVVRNHKHSSLGFIGQEMRLNPKYISRIFSDKGGITFRDFKIQAKMRRAKDLLIKSHLSVHEISIELGYQNPESFMRSFKRAVKMTPSQYRKKHGRRTIRYPRKD